MSSPNIARWHAYLEAPDPRALADMLHEDVIFLSPVVHTPQRGKAITLTYLGAAAEVLGNESFRYVREFDCGSRAVLEFECDIDGVLVNGVDLIEWDAEGRITEFKVMVRPLKAIQAVHRRMGEMLQRMQQAGSGA